MKKIIFLDIDGTIRDFDGFIPPSTIEAIKKARENGHEVCISSGRPVCQMEQRVMEIGFDGIISGSGSYVEYQGKCISHKCFTMLNYLNLCKYLLDMGYIMELQTYRESYLPECCRNEYETIHKQLQDRLGKEATREIPFPTVVESLMDINEVEKILLFGSEAGNQELIRKWGTSLHIVLFDIPDTEMWGGEITPQGINKAQGIESILIAGGFRRDDVIAVGDGGNDKEMLELAAVGIAMGNGTEEIKQIADIVTAPLRENGIQQVFQQLELI